MAFGRNYRSEGSTLFDYGWPAIPRNFDNNYFPRQDGYDNYNRNDNICSWVLDELKGHQHQYNSSRNVRDRTYKENCSNCYGSLPFKRQKFSENNWGCTQEFYWQSNRNVIFPPNLSNTETLVSFVAPPDTSGNHYVSNKHEQLALEDDDVAILMSKEDIETFSPSRKDGIDVLHETRLRYSYCAFIQNLGMRLDLPQATIGSAMVLCHRFFVRRSHACHDRFLVASAALFLAAKSEETARPLNDFVKASCEILYKQDLSILSYIPPIDWFEQYRERIIEVEQLILTTLNFELNVQHPYDPLTSILNKLGLSETVLVNLALNLVSEGFRSSLWLQFKPPQIAAGVAYLAAKMLNMNLDSYLSIWREFQTPPTILQEIERQLMELF